MKDPSPSVDICWQSLVYGAVPSSTRAAGPLHLSAQTRTYCLVVTEHGSPSIMLQTDKNSKKGQGLKTIVVEPALLLCSPGSSTLCKSLITP